MREQSPHYLWLNEQCFTSPMQSNKRLFGPGAIYNECSDSSSNAVSGVINNTDGWYGSN